MDGGESGGSTNGIRAELTRTTSCLTLHHREYLGVELGEFANVLVVQPAEEGMRHDAPTLLNPS